jgi:hypothetical protein
LTEGRLLVSEEGRLLVSEEYLGAVIVVRKKV